MIPKTLSASSILVSEACLERWKVENFFRTPQTSSEPANIGTSVHFALEHFVRDVYLDGKHDWSDVKHLKAYYDIGYIDTFGSADFDTDAYRDGAALVAKWYDENKTGLPNKVLSCEVKEHFDIKTSAGKIPFNFIWDRADQHSETVYEVVDYKTLRAPVRPEDLKRKIQPRAYALAAQIKWPHAERIWVTFDMLRYGPVGAVFTRDDNAATYRYLQRAAERIIAVDEDQTTETLNDECKWCIRKTSCETLLKANAGGTVHGLSLEEVADKKLQIASQLQALKYADEELDKQLLQEAIHRDEVDFDLGEFEVSIMSRPRRSPNSNAIINIVGPQIAAKYGNMTMTNIDKLLKSGELNSDQIAQIQSQINTTWSEPSAKVKKKVEF